MQSGTLHAGACARPHTSGSRQHGRGSPPRGNTSDVINPILFVSDEHGLHFYVSTLLFWPDWTPRNRPLYVSRCTEVPVTDYGYYLDIIIKITTCTRSFSQCLMVYYGRDCWLAPSYAREVKVISVLTYTGFSSWIRLSALPHPCFACANGLPCPKGCASSRYGRNKGVRYAGGVPYAM